MQDSGQWGARGGGHSQSGEHCFPTECPLPPRTTCLLRQYPTISEVDSRHGLEAKSTGHPNAGQRKGEGSRAGDEDDCISPSSCLPSSAPVPPLSEAGWAEATWIEVQRAGTVTSMLPTEHPCHTDTCLSSGARKTFLLNVVLIKSLLGSNHAGPPLSIRKSLNSSA